MKLQKAGEQKRKRKVTVAALLENGKNMGYKTAYGCTVFLYMRHEYYVNDAGDVFTANKYHRQISSFTTSARNGQAEKNLTEITYELLKQEGEYRGLFGDYNLRHYRFNGQIYFIDSAGRVLTMEQYQELA